jgi:ABC-type transporter Mla maintaining outer membrane lipid asymmetry permease subunit MlaE
MAPLMAWYCECDPNFSGSFSNMCHKHHMCRVFGKTFLIAFFIALFWSVIIALGALSFMQFNHVSNNHTNVFVSSLDINAALRSVLTDRDG